MTHEQRHECFKRMFEIVRQRVRTLDDLELVEEMIDDLQFEFKIDEAVYHHTKAQINDMKAEYNILRRFRNYRPRQLNKHPNTDATGFYD